MPKLLAFICLTFLSLGAMAQTRITVTGTIRDTAGNLLRGANVTVRGSTRIGTTSDENGRFILDVPENAILEFSSINYETLAVPARSSMNVVLHLNKNNLSDVVITAFGKKQRKEAVVGSVTSVNPEDLRIPASNLTNALAGQIAGVIAFQRSGQPGADNSQFFIRGVTTLGYSASPLILVDNVELTANDLARLNVDDIASFSILKDASAAALYGARGANGVILVTTKEGKVGKAKVNIRYENSISKPTTSVQLADPITYMNDYNEAVTTRNPLATPYFTPNQIQAATNTWNHAPGANPYLYPAVDWMSMLFRKQTTTNRANFSVQGGSEQAKYYISGDYSRDNGILQVNPVNNFNSGMKFENYQLRANVNVKITKSTEAIVRLWGNFNDYTGPITNDQSGLATDLYDKVLHTSPVYFPAFYAPDSANLTTHHILFGNNTGITGGLQDNPYADLMYGYKNSSESRMSAQFELNQNFNFITRGLAFHGIFSTNRYSYFDQQRSYKPFYYNIGSVDESTGQYTLNWLNNSPGAAQEFLSYYPGNKNLSTYIYMQGSLDYDRNFGDHHLSGTILGTREQTVNPNSTDPNTGTVTLSSSLPARNLGLSGRASYSFKDRYFLEFNFGYNGSEKFAPDHRFGFFPTIGAGYVISNENFWKGGVSKVFTRLKIRGSYGLVGNDNIGKQRFFYLSSVIPDNTSGPSASFGLTNGTTMYGTSILAYPNPDVTWETAAKSNLALEVEIAHNFNIIAEIYHEYRYNILINRGYIPVETGIEGTASSNLQANLGTAYSNGIDIHMDYKQRFSKDFQVTFMGNFTGTRDKAGREEEPQYPYPYLFHSGQPINQQFGYIAERLFVDDKEARNSPPQQFGSFPLPQGGDIKYRDINGDGVIDSYDQVPLGNPTVPQIVYGFGFSAIYKQFDVNAFFQGEGKVSFFMNPTAQNDTYNGYYGTEPFVNNAQLMKAYADNHWTEENQNLYALFPRFATYDNGNNDVQSSWWLRDGSFMRLKSLEVGFTLPRSWTHRIFMDNARIYFNGLNLITWSHFKLWDPEMAGQGFGYPIQKVFNAGINLNF
ncbi:MAG TPA: TonB-dependent receptor [Dinghuibacter sp.]|uniref:SusC/RagA family TonB-linked outer membrane protein n=1 Tax=Dinghuibacter sp. TaxID=2024697 RepID=UPI002C5B3B5E|nr:TonB-dependent receptor [Dinghuibacter sp.]HTJ14836.1 TonB-dependent receptor [Dinghuibacter sp.]